MDVDDRVEALEEGGREQPHVAREDDDPHAAAPRASPPSRPRRRRPPPGCPAARARSSARASALFDATAAIGSPASISAWRFVPSPEASTPITRSARSPAARPGSATTAQYPIPRLKTRRSSSSSTCRASHAKTGGRSHELQSICAAQALRQHAREVPLDPAAGHVRERLHVRLPAQRADVVEVEPRRREQVVAVVVLLGEHRADEREAVRVDARRRESRRRRRRRGPASRRSARRGRRSRRRSRRSRARPRGRRPASPRSRRRRARSRPRGRPPPRPRRARRPARARAGWRRRSRAGRAARRRSSRRR